MFNITDQNSIVGTGIVGTGIVGTGIVGTGTLCSISLTKCL